MPPVEVENVLEHYGVKGMKWGVVNEKDTSSTRSNSRKSESKLTPIKKAGTKSNLTTKEKEIDKKFDPDGRQSDRLKNMYGPESTKKSSESTSKPIVEDKRHGLTDGQKRALKIGAGVAIGGLVIYGGYKAHSEISIQRSLLKNQLMGEPLNKKAQKRVELLNPQKFGPENLKSFWNKYEATQLKYHTEGLTPEQVANFGKEAYHFKAGDIVKRVSTHKENEIRPNGFYAAYKSEDVERYKAALPVFWPNWGIGADHNTEGHIVSLRAKRDIKAPSDAETYNIFKSMLNDNIMDSDGIGSSTVKSWLSDFDPDLQKIPDEEFSRKAFGRFALKWIDNDDPVTEHFMNKLKAAGYDAVPDLNDAGMLADKPMRFIRGDLFEIAGHEKLTRDMISEAQEKILAIAHILVKSLFLRHRII